MYVWSLTAFLLHSKTFLATTTIRKQDRGSGPRPRSAYPQMSHLTIAAGSSLGLLGWSRCEAKTFEAKVAIGQGLAVGVGKGNVYWSPLDIEGHALPSV